MATVFLSVLGCLLLLDLQPSYSAPDPAAVFLSGQTADSILRRQKRYNSGIFEEFMEGDLERECLEEKCDLEEAREFFENDEKTMEFWAAYVDGDQCESSPCENQGNCTDQIGSYLCQCPPGFTGRNCEIVTTRRCDMNNGDCMHFCETMETFGATCSCAQGYQLASDGITCEPDVEFPCGRDALTVYSGMSSRSLLYKPPADPDDVTSLSASNIPITPTNTTTTATSPITATASASAGPLNTTTTTSPITATASAGPLNTTTTTSPITATAPASPLNTTGFLLAGNNSDAVIIRDLEPPMEPNHIKPIKRIVGGEAAVPGQVPWQAALVARPGGMVFCGGSILSELWVITAAHCLEEAHGAFYIRVGEHNIYVDDGTEQDHDVLEEHVHPRYDSSQSSYNHDIALLRLATPITFSVTARPICLGPRSFTESLVKEASPARVSGWGRMRYQGATATTLQVVDLPYTDRTECKDTSSSRITPYMFCAGYFDEKRDACQGDSGGPHANRYHDTWFLTGIVSWGEECAKQGKYGVYTRLSLYYRWIKHVMALTKHRLAFDLDEPDD